MHRNRFRSGGGKDGSTTTIPAGGSSGIVDILWGGDAPTIPVKLKGGAPCVAISPKLETTAVIEISTVVENSGRPCSTGLTIHERSEAPPPRRGFRARGLLPRFETLPGLGAAADPHA
ncbi:MAG: hypothetical protein MK179_21785, partial [Pirellulaceae bacterium]|nr:hypothetical protein [Pirellulaceae bacterium]MCH2203831.1 hypothetical protein [Fuerstiella sp.]